MDRAHSIDDAAPRAIPQGSPRGGRRTRRAGRAWAEVAGVALALLAIAAPAAARGGVYMFVDERGVTHFTDNPRGDPRYQLLIRSDAAPVSRFAAPRSTTYDGLIGQTARAQRLPPALVKAVIAAESAFNARAVSRKGAQGLMQLMPTTALQLGVSDPFEPAENVRGGTSYLRRMIDRYGDLTRALAAYNAGPTAVDRYGGVPPYRETRDYVERVLTYYRRYHGDFAR